MRPKPLMAPFWLAVVAILSLFADSALVLGPGAVTPLKKHGLRHEPTRSKA